MKKKKYPVIGLIKSRPPRKKPELITSGAKQETMRVHVSIAAFTPARRKSTPSHHTSYNYISDQTGVPLERTQKAEKEPGAPSLPREENF